MLTLHKIFFKTFLAQWLTILVASLILVLIEISFPNSVPNIISILLHLFILLAPAIHASLASNDFQDNLDWLINFQYNRKQLIRFFFITQATKLILMCISYLCIFSLYAGIAMIGRVENTESITIFSDIVLYLSSGAGMSFLYSTLILCAFVVFFSSLFKSNAEMVRRQEITLKSRVNSGHHFFSSFKNSGYWTKKRKHTSVFIATSLLIALNYNIDITIITYILTLCIGYFAIKLFNRKFKSFSLQQESRLGYAIAIALVLPYGLFYSIAVNQINDSQIENSKRVSNLDYVQAFYTVNTRKFNEIAKNVNNCESSYMLASYAGASALDTKHLFDNLPKECHATRLITSYTSKMQKKNIESLVQNTKNYIEKNALSETQQITLASRVNLSAFSKREIAILLDKPDPFNNYLAIRLAKRKFTRKRFNQFIKSTVGQLPDSVKQLGSVKRAIASEPVSNNKEDKNKFNANQY